MITDGTLFSAHVNKLKILSRKKVTLKGCFAIFPLIFAYHNVSTHTENTFNFESYILEGTIISYYLMSNYVFLIQRSPAQITRAKFPLLSLFPPFIFKSFMSKQHHLEYVK